MNNFLRILKVLYANSTRFNVFLTRLNLFKRVFNAYLTRLNVFKRFFNLSLMRLLRVIKMWEMFPKESFFFLDTGRPRF